MNRVKKSKRELGPRVICFVRDCRAIVHYFNSLLVRVRAPVNLPRSYKALPRIKNQCFFNKRVDAFALSVPCGFLFLD